jgi:hypothetical protein
MLTLLALFTLGAGVAVAPQPDADAAARVGEHRGTTIYDFDDDNVEGEVLSPDGANVSSRSRVKHASLIEIRPHFMPELIRMALDT